MPEFPRKRDSFDFKKLLICPAVILLILIIIIVFIFFILKSSGPVSNEMILISGGTFDMGSIYGDRTEKPVHKVEVSPFYMGKYEVTCRDYCEFLNIYQGQYREGVRFIYTSMPVNCGITCPSTSLSGPFDIKPGYEDKPVAHLTWYGAVLYCNWRSEKEGLEKCYDEEWNLDIRKKGYRLPTEAEWEYACRGGSRTDFYWGDIMDPSYCWFEYTTTLVEITDETGEHLYGKISEDKLKLIDRDFKNKKFSREELKEKLSQKGFSSHEIDLFQTFGKQYKGEIKEVGQKIPNNFGLYDMSGNVAEWCNDFYGDYPDKFVKDPPGAEANRHRIIRGGGWEDEAYTCRSTARFPAQPEYYNGGVGFRLVRGY